LLILRAFGQFKLLDDEGNDRAPLGQKPRAVLALLAMAPNFSRPRAWLQDKLWADRGPAQGAARLRQSLGEIRRALGPYRPALVSDRNSVSMDPYRFRVSLEPALSNVSGAHSTELFETIDVKEREFEHWIRDQRSLFAKRLPDSQNRCGISGCQRVIIRSVLESTILAPLLYAFTSLLTKAIFRHTQPAIDVQVIDELASAAETSHYDSGLSLTISLLHTGSFVRVSNLLTDIRTKRIVWTNDCAVQWCEAIPNANLERLHPLILQTTSAIVAAVDN
jgi:hypothetical protein